jgi:PAS domain S-box-containing protein
MRKEPKKKDERKTKEQLLEELIVLRKRLAELERSERKHKGVEQALQASEEKYRQLVKHAPTGISEVDVHAWRFVSANDVICDYTGYTTEELRSMGPLDLLTEDCKGLFLERQRKLSTGEKIPENVEYRIRSKDGSVFWVILNVRYVYENGKPTMATVVAHDITDRKRMEQELRSSEDRLRILFEYAPGGYYLSDLKGTFIDGNKAAEEITGYKRDELIGKSFLRLKLLPSKQIPKAAALLAQNALGKPTGPDEFTLNRKDGRQIPLEIRTYPVKIRGQTLVLGIARDITERKQAEEALRRSEERYALTTKAGRVGVWDWNLETNEIYVDPNLKALLGYADHEIRNHLDDWGKLVHPDDAERVMAEANAHLEGLTPHYDTAHRMVHKDGSIRWFLARGTAMRDKNGKPYRVVGTDTDITERKHAEKQRENLQKQLEEALTKILGGYISVCAQCKKIRDDSGNWIPIERYISSRTDAMFSHGLCPRCLKEFRASYENKKSK